MLKQLVEIETPSFDVAASEHIASVLESQFVTLGAQVRLIRTDAGTSLIIDVPRTVDAGSNPLLLVGHTDTVWPVGTLDSTVPWVETNGTIKGPGVFDMKAGIVVMLLAISRLRGTPHQAVRIVLTSDEEVGSPTTKALLQELGATSKAALGFESPHPDGALKVGRRGSSRVRISVSGRAAHAALDPEHGISAIDELIDQLLRVRDITTAAELPSEVLSNVGTLEGGARANVVPDAAWAEVGLRFIDPESERQVLAALRQLTPIRQGARINVELLSNRPAWRASNADAALLNHVRKVASEIGLSVDGRPASGAGDTNLLGSLGIPTIDGFGPRGGGAHAPSEHMVVASLFERADLLTALLARHENWENSS
ncbi:MAG: M20/M25/M40 family metallo-hydrolase [Leucobacter sp.]